MKLSRSKQTILFGLCGLILLIFVTHAVGLFPFAAGKRQEPIDSVNNETDNPTQKGQDEGTVPSGEEPMGEDKEPAGEDKKPVDKDEKPAEEKIRTVRVSGAPPLPQESVVAIVQSDKSKAADIGYDEIKNMIREAVALAGGFEGLVKDGCTVVLKPNLVEQKDYTLPNYGGRPLATEINGVTTDWRVTKAVVELVRELNPAGKVYVMEGAAGNTNNRYKYFNYDSVHIPGVDEFIAIEKDSGLWQDFESSRLVKVLLPNGLIHKEYYFNRRYYEADVVISLPVLKNHWHAAVTGGIKNVGVGATPANIYGTGPNNPGRHNMFDHESATGEIHKWIHDYYMGRPVDFVIMDGLQGVEHGPTPAYNIGGVRDIKNAQMNMRLIVAGRDAVAVDTIESLIIGWDPQSVGHLKLLGESMAGYTDPRRIKVVGRQVDQVRKYFNGVIPPAGGEKITDKEPPTLSITKKTVRDGILNLSLETGTDTIKAVVYVDDKMVGSSIISDYRDINIDIGHVGKGTHKLTVHTYDRFLNVAARTANITVDVAKRAPRAEDGHYIAARANVAPIIDGIANDPCWNTVPWAPIDQLWLGDMPSPEDFSGRYKMVWTPERLYYLIEIVDDVISNIRTNPLDAYHEDDCVELFIDEDHSGGYHTYNYNAFAYHIKTDYNILDLDTSRKSKYFNDHADVKWTKKGTTYTWEIGLDIYDDTFVHGGDNTKVSLYAGKKLGYAVAYCDADETGFREHFMGSIYIPGANKNVAWQNASVFGTLTLIELD